MPDSKGTVLITGASRGIGLAFAQHYARDGWQVIATCRAPERASALQALAAQHPAVRIEKLDVTAADDIAALAATLTDTPLDILINNAGIVSGSDADDPIAYDPSQFFGSIDATAWEKVLRVDAVAPVMVSQALLPHIELGRLRKIIMISSRCGSIAQSFFPEVLAYNTAKAALNMAMRNMALLLREKNIIVASLHPGYVQTDMCGPEADISPEASATGMAKVIESLSLEQTGSFLTYEGEMLPW